MCVHLNTRRGVHQGEHCPMPMQCKGRQFNWFHNLHTITHHNLLVMNRNYTVKRAEARSASKVDVLDRQNRVCANKRA